MTRQQISSAFTASVRILPGTALALGAAVAMVRIFINSGVNGAGLASMPVELARQATGVFGQQWPVVAPFIGALGSFISGSATFSNMTFSLLQFTVAEEIGVTPSLILSLQLLGADAGNMACVHNVVAAAAVVGMQGKEGTIIRFTAVPMVLFCLYVGIIGLLLARSAS